jgi:agmatine deiminase
MEMRGRLPAEFEPQELIWIGFPHDAQEWPGALLERARAQIAGFASAIAESGQETRLAVRDAGNAALAKSLASKTVTLEQHAFGDIWLRDTGPLTVLGGTAPNAPVGGRKAQRRIAHRFGFNGWGGKFLMEGDQTIGADLARAQGLPITFHEAVLEGGAIDTDGAGRCITTEQCLLNPNRASGTAHSGPAPMSKAVAEAMLREAFGFNQIIWLGQGLIGDHTDGHVDNLARFVGPGHVAIPEEAAQNGMDDDPNAAVFADAHRRARESGLTVTAIPSAGKFMRSGEIEAASYANFVITNKLIVVPQFGLPQDAEAAERIAALFPERDCIGLPMDAVLAGGGGFHCASMQLPEAS